MTGESKWRYRLAQSPRPRSGGTGCFGNRTFSNVLVGVTNYSFAIGVDEQVTLRDRVRWSTKTNHRLRTYPDILDYTAKLDLEHRPFAQPLSAFRRGRHFDTASARAGSGFWKSEGGQRCSRTPPWYLAGWRGSLQRSLAFYVEDDMTSFSGLRSECGGARLAMVFRG